MVSVEAVLESDRIKIIEPEKVTEFRKTLPVGTRLEVTFRRWEDGRSLRANALFHALVGRYAKENGESTKRVKLDFKHEYGVWATFEQVMTDAPPYRGELVPYHGDLLFFKTTADYTVREFHELMKGALAECHDSGVYIDDIIKEQERR